MQNETTNWTPYGEDFDRGFEAGKGYLRSLNTDRAMFGYPPHLEAEMLADSINDSSTVYNETTSEGTRVYINGYMSALKQRYEQVMDSLYQS